MPSFSATWLMVSDGSPAAGTVSGASASIQMTSELRKKDGCSQDMMLLAKMGSGLDVRDTICPLRHLTVRKMPRGSGRVTVSCIEKRNYLKWLGERPEISWRE